jgi:hypothetical protein
MGIDGIRHIASEGRGFHEDAFAVKTSLRLDLYALLFLALTFSRFCPLPF